MTSARIRIRGLPTLALALASVALFTASAALALLVIIPLPAASLLSALACYLAFTPVHEAAHGNVSGAGVVGRIASALLVGSFAGYRFLHREHHAHVNDAGADPDHWSARRCAPLRWLTQDFAYAAFFVRRWRARPLAERADFALSALLPLVVLVVAVSAAGAGDAATLVIALWWAPARAALFILAWTFAWLPHRPHDAGGDRFRATTLSSSPLLNVVLLGQSYHLLHHLQPRLPWHTLARVWREEGATMRALGAIDRRRRPPRAHWQTLESKVPPMLQSLPSSSGAAVN